MKYRSLCLRNSLAALAATVLASAALPNTAFGTEPTTQPTTQPTEATTLPTAPSAAPTAEAVVDPLVQQARAYIGDPYATSRLAFTFVFFIDGVRIASRTYDWRPGDGTLTVGDGRRSVEFSGIDRIDPSAATDHPRRNSDVWRSVAPDARPRRAASAWSGFINDRYWLLAPALATGPDTDVTVEENIVHVFFPSGGVTPGDRYDFLVDRDTGAITEWAFHLASGRDGAFQWLDYEAFGPLHLSLRRVSNDGPFEIRFEDIIVE